MITTGSVRGWTWCSFGQQLLRVGEQAGVGVREQRRGLPQSDERLVLMGLDRPQRRAVSGDAEQDRLAVVERDQPRTQRTAAAGRPGVGARLRRLAVEQDAAAARDDRARPRVGPGRLDPGAVGAALGGTVERAAGEGGA